MGRRRMASRTGGDAAVHGGSGWLPSLRCMRGARAPVRICITPLLSCALPEPGEYHRALPTAPTRPWRVRRDVRTRVACGRDSRGPSPACSIVVRTWPRLLPSVCARSGRATCAMVLAEIAKSRERLAVADCSEHTRKVLEMQLLQLEQVATVVQKGEGVVVGGV